MKVSMLMENRACAPDYCCVHGVSMLIEAGGRSLLFDAGPNSDFMRNAKTLGADLAGVDIAVLSHAHSDHGGGLPAFLAVNGKAPLYVGRNAFADYQMLDPDENGVLRQSYAGVDQALAQNPRVRHAGEVEVIDETFTLFGMPEGHRPRYPIEANLMLLEPAPDGGTMPDRFLHEQNLLVREGGKTVLFSGCAHSGIVDILERAEALSGGPLDAVLGGFHLQDPDTGAGKDDPVLGAIAADLAKRENTQYYAFHCTGDAPFRVLQKILGGRVRWLSAGTVLDL